MTTRKIAIITAGVSSPSSTRMLADRLAAAVGEALRSTGVPAQVEIVELRGHDDLVLHRPRGGVEQLAGAVVGDVEG